jgi:hypothetical protein
MSGRKMSISKQLEHIVNNKLTVIMGFIDMAMIEDDAVKRHSLLSSAKKAVHDTTRVLSLNADRETPHEWLLEGISESAKW